MATIVGQYVGSYIGGPIGGAIGAAIGSYVDQEYILPALFPAPDIQGARLDSIQLSAASEGASMVRGFGPLCKNEATYIWISPIRELVDEESLGKGGGGQQVENVSYRADVALAFSETSLLPGGRIQEVDFIWMDGTLVYDRDANVSIVSSVLTFSAPFRLYGSNTYEKVSRIDSPTGGPDLGSLRTSTNVTVAGSTGVNNGTFECIESRSNTDGTSYAVLRNPIAVAAAAGPSITLTQTNLSIDPGFANAIVIYPGDQAVQDPTMVAVDGAANVPNYRQSAFFVIINMDLTATQGRLPSSVQVQYKAETSTTRAQAIRLICRGGGLVESVDFDVAGVTGDLKSLLQRGPVTPVSGLQQLMIAFDIQVQDRDGVLTFYDHSAVDVITVDPDDMAAHAEGSDDADYPLRQRDDRYRDAPKTVVCTYVDEESELQNGSQLYQKVDASTDVVVNARLDIVLSAAEAQCICRRLLWQLHSQATSMAVQLPPSYVAAIENDVLLVTGPDSNQRRLLVQTFDDGRNGLRKYDGVEDQGTTVTFDVADCVVELSVIDDQRVYASAVMALLMMDLPPLVDAHVNLPILYWSGTPIDSLAVFGGAGLYSNPDLSNTITLAEFLGTRSRIGFATTALATAADPFLLDTLHAVTVQMYHGVPSSAVLADVLAGANLALLGDEIIGFTTVVANGGDSYTLSGLLRGLRGTDDEIATHVVGERFALLTLADTQVLDRFGVAVYGRTFDFRLLATGASLITSGPPQEPNVVLNYNTLRPFSPAAPRCIRNTATNDITISWARRTRTPYANLSGNALPEDEATRKYDVLVYTAAHAVLKRTTEVINVESLLYTSAQQTTDGFTPGAFATLALDLFQKNPVVGRSKARRVTVTIEAV